MKVAAICPTLGRPLADLIRLWRRQDYEPRKLVIVLNERGWVDSDDDDVVVCRLNRNVGASRGRDIGIAIALSLDCDALCFWDDDDVPAPNYMSRMVAALEASGSPVAACGLTCRGVYNGPKHIGTQNRMLRADVIGDARWKPCYPAQDKAFWSQFSRLPCAMIDEPLIVAGCAPTGGFRSPRAVLA